MYSTPPPAPLRPIRSLGTATVVMLAVDSLVYVIASVIDVQRVVLIDRFLADSDAVPIRDLQANDARYLISGLVESVAFAATGVMFLIWLFRARANAEILSPWPHRRAKPWLIFGWVVPIVNFVFPKQIVDDIWTSSKPGAIEESAHFTTARRAALVWAWWLAWLVTGLLATVGRRTYANAEEMPAIRNAAVFDIVGNVLSIATAALAIAIVMTITRFQEDRREAAAWGWTHAA